MTHNERLYPWRKKTEENPLPTSIGVCVHRKEGEPVIYTFVANEVPENNPARVYDGWDLASDIMMRKPFNPSDLLKQSTSR